MRLGAIVVVGANGEALTRETADSTAGMETKLGTLLVEPLACVEVGGRSTIERTIERFLRAGAEIVTVLVEAEAFYRMPPFRSVFDEVTVQDTTDLNSAIIQKLSEYSQNGIEHSFLISANAYAETDLLDLFYFHREARRAITRAAHRELLLDLWVVNCASAQQPNLLHLLEDAGRDGTFYLIREYVGRLTHPRDLRRFAADMLRGRLECRPCGREARPGVWIEDHAEVHRRARIVAPAYIGRGSKISQDALITRFSSIERDCFVDCGTVIEESSLLANTHIGIWLDVCHAVVRGNKMLSLGRDVMIEISDPSIMRTAIPVREADFGVRGRDEAAPMFQKQPLAAHAWQFGSNLMQE